MKSVKKWEIAGGIITFLFSAGIFYTLVSPPSKEHYNPSHNLHIQDTCVALSVPVIPTPPNDKTEPKTKEQYDKEKWCAERSSLASQWKATDITYTAFWAGLLGIWLVGWTLIATRQATKVARDSVRREQRAYMTIPDYVLHTEHPNRALQPNIINSGKTPAYNIVTFSKFSQANSVEEIDFSDFRNGHAQSISSIGSNAPARGTGVTWKFDLPTNKPNIYVWGFIEYSTIFKQRCITRFCVRVNIQNPNERDFNKVRSSSDVTPIHNSTEYDNEGFLPPMNIEEREKVIPNEAWANL